MTTTRKMLVLDDNEGGGVFVFAIYDTGMFIFANFDINKIYIASSLSLLTSLLQGCFLEIRTTFVTDGRPRGREHGKQLGEEKLIEIWVCPKSL